MKGSTAATIRVSRARVILRMANRPSETEECRRECGSAGDARVQALVSPTSARQTSHLSQNSVRARVDQCRLARPRRGRESRSEEHTSELQSLMRISYAVFCLKKKMHKTRIMNRTYNLRSSLCMTTPITHSAT